MDKENLVIESRLVVEIVKRSQPILFKASKHKVAKPIGLNESDQYIISSFHAVIGAVDKSRQFYEAVNFLREYPTQAVLQKHKISHLHFVDYHTNALYSFYTSFSDCILMITNSVLRLGLGPKEVTWKNVKKHPIVKETGLLLYIQALNEANNIYSGLRNHMVHQGRSYMYSSLTNYFYLEMLKDDDKVKDIYKIEKKYLKSSYEERIKSEINGVKNNFEKILDITVSIMEPLFDEFYKQVEVCEKK